MKKLLLSCALVWASVSCSTNEPGPEYTTFPEIINEFAQPDIVTEKDKVTVTADVRNTYGAFTIYIFYQVGSGSFQTASVQKFNPTEETIHYKGWIPAQKAGSRVQWVVRCLNNFNNLLSQTGVRSYDVRASIPDPEEQPE